MRFKVSTNIKSILGKDMISDKFIAIFELVKNSCDAGATFVNIEFSASDGKKVNKIIIADNGCGMTSQDLQDKWLFMAYSEKRHSGKKHKFAGSKGIGRFSCDRLGEHLILTTKKEREKGAERLYIDWSLFEKNDEQKVEEIELEHEAIVVSNPYLSKSGTILEITALREEWSRTDILRLRAALMKLVSPEKAEENNGTTISIIANHEKKEDEKVLQQEAKIQRGSEARKNSYGNLIVNGPIVNDVFEKLGLKTTSITVNLAPNGETIETVIEDRGEFIFRIVRKNETYDKLEDIKIKVFYLNRAAKLNFARIMGIDSVNYGSVFVYKNGFRVLPYGTTGNDFFGINERKAQGYNRYLGTREIMGRIQIDGDNDKFIEKSSRDGGFIQNLATIQLTDFFIAEVIRVLEKYVVEGIDWGDPARNEFVEGKNEQGLTPIEVADKIIVQFSNLTKRGDVIEAQINPSIIKYARPQEDELQKSIKGLERIASVAESEEIIKLVEEIKRETATIRKQKDEAEKSVEAMAESLRRKEEALLIRERQTASLRRKMSINSIQYEDALHVIYTIAEANKRELDKIYSLIDRGNKKLVEKVSNAINNNKRIFKLSDLSINYDYGISSKKPKDLISFVKQYVKDFWADKINVFVTALKEYQIVCNFDVSKLSLIIDNILSNSKKAKASEVEITIQKYGQNIYMNFRDNGVGLSNSISNPENIFERGFSSTFGFGLGLYHTKLIIEEMQGSIRFDESVKHGFALEVAFKYECKY